MAGTSRPSSVSRTGRQLRSRWTEGTGRRVPREDSQEEKRNMVDLQSVVGKGGKGRARSASEASWVAFSYPVNPDGSRPAPTTRGIVAQSPQTDIGRTSRVAPLLST